jgi:hypothetical protein
VAAKPDDEQPLAAERKHAEEGAIVRTRQRAPALATVVGTEDMSRLGCDVEPALRRDGDLIQVIVERSLLSVLPDLAAVRVVHSSAHLHGRRTAGR